MSALRKPSRRDLLIVINRLQGLISNAQALHGNDRDPHGFARGQAHLRSAFTICLAALGRDEPTDDLTPRDPELAEVIDRECQPKTGV